MPPPVRAVAGAALATAAVGVAVASGAVGDALLPRASDSELVMRPFAKVALEADNVDAA
jgi:hypothetical protein